MSEPIKVEATLRDGLLEPRAFHWRGQRYRVLDLGRRWRAEGQFHWLVRTEAKKVYELVYDEAEGQWYMGQTPADLQPRGPAI